VRIVGLDIGRRRIGVAISDASGTLARPVGAVAIARLDDTSVAQVLDEMAQLVDSDEQIATVVVGLPRRLDGSANDMTAPVQAFAAQLEQRLGMPVVLQDERLTSREAESRLALRDKDWRTRKKKIDAAAAAIILQDYLDSRS
jgi:putative holliday junction resolvase